MNPTMRRTLWITLGLVPGVGVGFATHAWMQMRSERLAIEKPAPPPARTGIPLNEQGRLSLFVLAGQSNMSGRGALSAAQKAEHVYVFGNDYRWKEAREPIDSAEGQVDEVSADRNAGLGPGLAFALRLAELQPGKRIGLIPCAKGATTLFEWERRLGEDTLYGSCLKRVRAASLMGQVSGVLFFQGEWDAFDSQSDAPLAPVHVPPNKLPGSRVPFERERFSGRPSLNHVSHDRWKDMFEDLVDSLRSDLRDPALPVVFARIGTHKNPERYVHWQDVQRQQDEVSLPHVTMIETDDLTLADTVHFDTASYVTIGRRFAEGYVRSIETSPQVHPRKGIAGLPAGSTPGRK